MTKRPFTSRIEVFDVVACSFLFFGMPLRLQGAKKGIGLWSMKQILESFGLPITIWSLFIFGVIILGLIYLFRAHRNSIHDKYGRHVVFIINFSLLCLTTLFFSYLRLYLTYKFGFLLEEALPWIIGTSAVFVSGGDVNPQSNPETTSVSQVANRHEAGPSNPGQWNSFPSVPSDLPALPADFVAHCSGSGEGSSSNFRWKDYLLSSPEGGDSVQGGSEPTAENPLAGEVPHDELHTLVKEQLRHYCERGLSQWKVSNTPERDAIYGDAASQIIRSLEIADNIEEKQEWINQLRANPRTLHSFFKEYKVSFPL